MILSSYTQYQNYINVIKVRFDELISMILPWIYRYINILSSDMKKF
jgi:hypothetical protein